MIFSLQCIEHESDLCGGWGVQLCFTLSETALAKSNLQQTFRRTTQAQIIKSSFAMGNATSITHNKLLHSQSPALPLLLLLQGRTNYPNCLQKASSFVVTGETSLEERCYPEKDQCLVSDTDSLSCPTGCQARDEMLIALTAGPTSFNRAKTFLG